MDAIQATFSDFKLIKSRSVVQLVLELPIEAADAALQVLGGIPQPGAERWVGIAPLLLEPEAKAAVKALATTEGERARIRAVMLCKDHDFQRWILPPHWHNNSASRLEEMAAEKLRHNLQIPSRSELATNAKAREMFRQLEAAYAQGSGKLAEARG